ncbi:MAG: hypothetical protein V4532_13970, partial [Pseudomonadota bacterium]
AGGDHAAESDAALEALKHTVSAAPSEAPTRTRIKATPKTFDRLREEGGSGPRRGGRDDSPF